MLVDQRLVRQVEQPDGSTRSGMLETIREFLLTQLVDVGEDPSARQRHADYVLTLAESMEQLNEGPEQIEAMDRLEQEHANVRVALDWFASRGDAESGLRLAGAAWQFWHLHGHLTEGRQQYARLFALPHDDVPSQVRALALTGAGALAMWQQDAEAAVTLQEAALRIWRSLPLPDQRGAGVSLACLGDIASDLGKLAEAQTYYEELLVLGRQLGSARGTSAGLMLLGRLAYIRGEMDEATTPLREAATVSRDAGDLWLLSLALQHLGTIAMDRGAFTEAEEMLEEALELDRRMRARRHLVHCQLRRAWLDLYRGQPKAAVPRIDEAIAIARELGERTLTAYGLSSAGWASRLLGDLDRAEQQCLEALGLAQAVKDPIMTIMILDGITHLYVARGRMELAVRLAAATAGARDSLGNPPTEPDRVDNQQSIAHARQRLSTEQFDAAWKHGQAMSLDEAAAVALEADSAPEQASSIGVVTVLTQRELQVLRLIAEGKADKEIAAILAISNHTVGRHVQNILAKLDLPSRTAAAAWAIRHGMV